ncbi:hypothetical protein PR048_029225 [Dryococelus australis]|uniref:Uncharacterized protein n=1 Tax=Dryococelus australis TaxID=614101 RepID=A0ABQ9GFZ1_9NEOP|nr:hypothetical protein PR048_029225 [Dryococelus australis]
MEQRGKREGGEEENPQTNGKVCHVYNMRKSIRVTSPEIKPNVIPKDVGFIQPFPSAPITFLEQTQKSLLLSRQACLGDDKSVNNLHPWGENSVSPSPTPPDYQRRAGRRYNNCSANRVQYPAGSPGHRQPTMPLVGGFSRGSPVSPAPSSRRCSIPTSIARVGSQDVTVKSRPNLFTRCSATPEAGGRAGRGTALTYETSRQRTRLQTGRGRKITGDVRNREQRYPRESRPSRAEVSSVHVEAPQHSPIVCGRTTGGGRTKAGGDSSDKRRGTEAGPDNAAAVRTNTDQVVVGYPLHTPLWRVVNCCKTTPWVDVVAGWRRRVSGRGKPAPTHPRTAGTPLPGGVGGRAALLSWFHNSASRCVALRSAVANQDEADSVAVRRRTANGKDKARFGAPSCSQGAGRRYMLAPSQVMIPPGIFSAGNDCPRRANQAILHGGTAQRVAARSFAGVSSTARFTRSFARGLPSHFPALAARRRRRN